MGGDFLKARRGAALSMVALVLFLGFVRAAISHRRSEAPMPPAPDLRRLTFPAAGLTVSEHGPERLHVYSDSWTLFVQALTPEAAENFRSAMRGIVAHSPVTCREDVLSAPGAPNLYRCLREVKGPHLATQADYLISFDGSWALASAVARKPGDLIDIEPIDRFLQGCRLAERHRPDSEVLPAWRAYQRNRKPGTPIGKFVLSMAPAPVCVGSRAASERAWQPFTDAEYQRGGRQIALDLFEFYTKDDPVVVRVDLWTEEPPRRNDGETVFNARLRVVDDAVFIWSSGTVLDAPVTSGDYDVTVTLVNRGQYEERVIPEQERLERDALERYEIRLKPRPAE